MPPNYTIINTFLYWLANNIGYRTGTIRLARFVLQDYFKECGFDLTERARMALGKTILKIKKNHFVKYQSQGKAPMMYADLKNILESIPDDHPDKDFDSSIFLLALNTAQRASTLVSVKFNDVVVNKNRETGEIKNLTVIFNTTKGIKENAGLRKTIQY